MFNNNRNSKIVNSPTPDYTVQDHRARATGAPPGDTSARALSNAHIRPGRVSLYAGGSLMVASKPHSEHLPQVGGGRRGTIVGFSRSSRRRMLYMLAKTERAKKPFMCTLTYPGEFSASPELWKRDLKVFLQRFRRAFPAAGGVWKLEPQQRGAPHFHLLVWLPSISAWALSKWVALNWFEVVGSGDQRHYLWHLGALGNGNRPCVEEIRSSRGVMAYAAKYVGKVSDKDTLGSEWTRAGRFWGVFGPDHIPWADEIMEFLTYKQAICLFRAMRRFARLKARQSTSLTIFCDADFWRSRLNRLL